MSGELEERLRSHARSFDGLLSLIPAKLYYGEDVSDQWKRKKQTLEQKRAARIAKLDPDNWKSAKDVLDERAVVAKRQKEEEQGLQEQGGVVEISIQPELPKILQDQEGHIAKRRKLDDTPQPQQNGQPFSIEEKKQKKIEKKAAKQAKALKEKEKLERRNARKQAEKTKSKQSSRPEDDGDVMGEAIPLDRESIDYNDNVDRWSTVSSDADVPDIFSPPAESGSSSISSLPPSITDQPAKSKPLKSKQAQPPVSTTSQTQLVSLPTQPQPESKLLQSAADREAARSRLADAISSFRSARKADEPTSNKPRNRAELLEQRRRKEEAKRQLKKEQRRKEREEAARKEDEEIERRFSPGGSGSLLTSPRSPPTKDNGSSSNYSYGRIEFGDGSQVDTTTMNGLLDPRKKKGPQDTHTALKAAQSKASRLAGLDEAKRRTIEEQDMWLNAKKRAHGERVKDDTSLLKKALKRQESQKKKSEKEWTDRKEGVARSQEAKQKKRTENLAKRKEEKHAHKVGKKGKKIKKRPGFEGSFRGRTGGGKKKS